MADKNQAIIDYLLQCPSIQNSPLYFNFIQAKNDNKQIVTVANDKLMDRTYIDGSVQKRYTFSIIDYKSIAYDAVVKQEGYTNENVDDILQVQEIINWIDEQEALRNYPNFGEECVIDDIRALSSNPNLNGVDTNASPSLAKYSISIQVDYVDYSNADFY